MSWSYGKCAKCPKTYNQILPAGSKYASIMMIGDSPNVRDEKRGEPMCGQAGQELDYTYLRLAGLDRSDLFLTYCVQCRHVKNGADVRASDSTIQSCATNHVPEELKVVSPKVLILSGSVACSLIPTIDLETDHGYPQEAELFGWRGTVVPMYSPAVGMHESRFMIQMLEDWERFGHWLRGTWSPPKPDNQHSRVKTNYRLIPPGKFFEYVNSEPEVYTHLPIDTESDEGKIWSVQFSTQPGVGFMFKTEDQQNIDDFRLWLSWAYGNRVAMHNSVWDLGDLFQIGMDIGIDDLKPVDTMMDSFHIGNKPQGLKPLVYRLFGHRMISYKETVIPWSKRKLEEWLYVALDYISSSMRTTIQHPVGKNCPTCGKHHRKDVSVSKPHEAEAVLRRVLGKLVDGSDYDPWQPPKYSKGVESTRLLGKPWLKDVEAAVGRMPRCSIVHVPIDEAVNYGCSDADWTGRVATWFEQERKRIVKQEWKVA